MKLGVITFQREPKRQQFFPWRTKNQNDLEQDKKKLRWTAGIKRPHNEVILGPWLMYLSRGTDHLSWNSVEY